jgi:subtilisin family serine protease
LPPLCLPQIRLPLLECAAPSGETQPRVVTPTTVRYDSRRLIVAFRTRTSRNTIDDVFGRAGVQQERKLTQLGFYVVTAPDGEQDQALTSLRHEASVVNVERETLLDGLDTTPNDPAWPDQWGLRIAGFPRAWDVTHGSSKVIVAVLDTGVDGSHPDLKGAIVPGRDIVHRNDDPADDNGHGTAVAGIIAARGNNGIGLAGACWTCLVMPVKVLGKDGTGTTGDVSAGIIWAADHGARVINLSLGAPGTTDALSEAIAYASSKDVVVVASAGNSGSVTPFYPAADGSVISVAASNPSDQLYSWSNRGTWVLVAAPGCNDALWPGGEYVSFCGTSAAAPLVAGIAALFRAAKPSASATETADAVSNAVDEMSPDVRYGRVNAGLALSGVRASNGGTVRRTTVALHGRLSARRRSRIYKRNAAAGPLVGTLRFSPRRRLSLMLSQPGRRVVRVSGKSPLRLRRTVSAGPITLVIRGRGTKASYRLTLSYAVE